MVTRVAETQERARGAKTDMLPRNYAPSLGLRGFIRRHYVFEADLPDDYILEDKLLSEFPFIRILVKGEWTAEISPGNWTSSGRAVFFGPNARPLNVRCQGSFKVVGFAVRPSGWKGLFPCPANEVADQMLPLSDLIGSAADDMLQGVINASDDHAAIEAIENVMLAVHEQRGRPNGDPAMRLFEDIAQFDSMTPVQVAAERLGISVRQLERRCLTTFGHLPKTILRRSRFLDMATALRGFSDPDQELLAALRYFDQSHRTSEFKHFIGLPPGAFEKAPTPLLTAGLKLRAEGLT